MVKAKKNAGKREKTIQNYDQVPDLTPGDVAEKLGITMKELERWGQNNYGLPSLLTQDEVIEILRLDDLGVKKPKETLRYLRRTKQIGFVIVAGKVLIPIAQLHNYMENILSQVN